MTFDDRQLREIEANEAWLARFGSPVPDSRLLADVKQAVRVTVNEQWLDRTADATPSPDASTVGTIKAAIRRELSTGRPVHVGERNTGVSLGKPTGGRRLYGAFSAAAMIALAVGVIRFAPANRPEITRIATTTAPDELFLASFESIPDEMEPELLAIEAGLERIESEGWSGVDSYDSKLDLELDNLWDEVEKLGSSTSTIFETS